MPSMLINPDTFSAVYREPPDRLLPWLTHQASLTEKLKNEANVAHLQVLKQAWETPDWWDKHVLNIGGELVLHREIAMWVENEPCWYARTIFPQTTYIKDAAFFDRLQNESLGQLIFGNNEVKRISLVNHTINHQSIEYHWINKWINHNADELWVRKSTFVIAELSPFFLIEIILPGLLRCVP